MSQARAGRSLGAFAARVGRRLVAAVLTLLVASLAIVGAEALIPGSPAAFILGSQNPTPGQIAYVDRELGLSQPFLERYWHWLSDVVHGDFGSSFVLHEPVTDALGPRIGTTLLLVAMAAVIIVVGGLVLGVAKGLGSPVAGGAVSLVTTLAVATPSFVVAVVLISVFSVWLGWLPAFGTGSGLGDELRHLILPAVALALLDTAFVARITAASMADERDADHVVAAIARGIPRRQVIRRHVVRNGLIPTVTSAGLAIAGLIGGTVAVEKAFALNGIGALLVSSVLEHDLPIVQAITLMLVAVFVVVNMVIDLLYSALDPRVRAAGEGRA